MEPPLILDLSDPKWKLFVSEFDPDQFVEMTLKILNSICSGRDRGKTTIIMDSTDVCVDINWFKNTYRKSDLENRDFPGRISNWEKF